MTCPPCTNDCNQGRTCPARNKATMTQDEIVKMAREAGGCEIGYGSTLWVGTQSTEFLEAFAKLVAAKERERLASIAEKNGNDILAIQLRGKA